MGEVIEANFANKDSFSRQRKIFTSFQIKDLSQVKVGEEYIPFYDGERAPRIKVVSEPGPFLVVSQKIPGTWFVVEFEAKIKGKVIQVPIEASDFNIIPNKSGLYSNFAFLVKAEDADKVKLGEVKKIKK